MILSALNAHHRRLTAENPKSMPPYGFTLQKVTAAIELGADGQFLGLLDLHIYDSKGQSPSVAMMVPDVGKRPGRQIKPAFLCDSAAFLLGIDTEDPVRAVEKFQASKAHHVALLGKINDQAAKAIILHFEKWRPETAAGFISQNQLDLLRGWLVFWADGSYAHNRQPLRDAWARHATTDLSEVRGQCLVTGELAQPIARLHPAIKGAGGQSAGTSLVSFNFDAAESYGKHQSYNAPVSEVAAFGYGAALNHLLRESDRRRTVGDMTVVVWAERPNSAEDLLLALIDPDLDLGEDAPAESRVRAEAVHETLDHLVEGRRPPAFRADENVSFHLLGLSPNTARLSVRLWQTAALGELLDHIGEHQRDLALVTDFPRRSRYPSLWSLIHDLRLKDSDGKARGRADGDRLYKLHGDLMRAIVTGQPYPAVLLPLLQARFRSDGHITHPRVALLKAVLSRRDPMARKSLPIALDETRHDTGYLLGRLFAALEWLQRAALGDGLRRSIRNKYIAAATTTPRDIFNHLLPLSELHRRKTRRDNPGGLVIGQVMTAIKDIPAMLSPDDQALFFIGYYQQRHELFTSLMARSEQAVEAV